MPLEEKVSLAKMKKEDLRFSQVFLICIFDVRLILKMRNMKILCTSYGKEFKRLTD
jgi:hypothetical protein